MFKIAHLTSIVFISSFLLGCAGPYPGPDKQFAGTLSGAATGAGAGAVTGFQVGSGTGPGAVVGAGVGAVVGAIRGSFQDSIEERLLKIARETNEERKKAIAREILADHYSQRLDLHPSRDIYPSDLFFKGDQATLRPEAKTLVSEIAKMNKERLAWSPLIVAVYVRGSEEDGFAANLADRRGKELVNSLVEGGLEPRRLSARSVVVPAPILIDPHDDPLRYNQAVEFIPTER